MGHILDLRAMTSRPLEKTFLKDLEMDGASAYVQEGVCVPGQGWVFPLPQ